MKYYGSWATNSLTTSQLIQNADGGCIAWTDFLIDVLRAQGDDVSFRDIRRIQMASRANGQPFATNFLVKNWTFGPANVPQNQRNTQLFPAGFNWYNVPAAPVGGLPAGIKQDNGVWSYNWQGNHPVDYISSSDQNNTNPLATFSQHVVVMINNVLYDPSYGVTYGSNLTNPTANDLLAAFESSALSGYVLARNFNGQLVYAYSQTGTPATVASRLRLVVGPQP